MAAAESNGNVATKTPVHLWIVGVLALLWNFGGVFDYLATQLQLEFYMKQFTEEMLTYFYGMPAWATAFWAFGVWGAFVGSIGLLLRKSWAFWAFAVSLGGLFFSSIYSFVLSDGAEIMGMAGTVMTAFIWVLAIFLLLYSRAMCNKGVLR